MHAISFSGDLVAQRLLEVDSAQTRFLDPAYDLARHCIRFCTTPTESYLRRITCHASEISDAVQVVLRGLRYDLMWRCLTWTVTSRLVLAGPACSLASQPCSWSNRTDRSEGIGTSGYKGQVVRMCRLVHTLFCSVKIISPTQLCRRRYSYQTPRIREPLLDDNPAKFLSKRLWH